MNAVFVTRFAPQVVGHGGYHRSYQVLHDLQSALGADHVQVYAPPQPPTAPAPAPAPVTARPWAAAERRLDVLWQAVRLGGHPYRLVAHILSPLFRTRWRFGTAPAEPYRRWLAQQPRPLVCVVDHPHYAGFTAVNQALGIPTINCSHNLETFDLGELDLADEWSQYAFIADFIGELKWLAACDARLLISRVEAGLVGGLGYPTRYYPYLPVGALHDRLTTIRGQRAAAPPESGLCVMVGSAAHETTRAAFAWFIAAARRHGLPAGVRVVIGGLQTDTLLPAGDRVPGLEVRSWLSQPDLDDLLARCAVFAAPQASGFGALTRLPELACAGIPVLVSEHASQAVDLPPGALALPNEWPAWRTALAAHAQATAAPTAAAYAEWAARQPRPLTAVLEQFADARA